MLKQHKFKSKMAECHPDKTLQARKMCKNCYDKWLKINNPEFRARQRLNCNQWYEKNKDRASANSKAWKAKQDPAYREYTARSRAYKKYGLTVEDYDLLLAGQDGVCGICLNPPKEGKRLAIDHCHETGKVRGLLCFRCNFGMSFFGEKPEAFFRAYGYLLLADGKKYLLDLEENHEMPK